jgi:hypothetical protein
VETSGSTGGYHSDSVRRGPLGYPEELLGAPRARLLHAVIGLIIIHLLDDDDILLKSDVDI